jgi:hypothetical protein
MLRARLRSGPSAKVVVMIDRPAGAVKAAAAPLEEARDDEQRAVVDEPARGRGDGEDGQGDEQRPPAAEQVRGPAAQQQEAAVAEHVAGDDPLQLRGRQVQVGVMRAARTPTIETSSPSRKSTPQSTTSRRLEEEKRESMHRRIHADA